MGNTDDKTTEELREDAKKHVLQLMVETGNGHLLVRLSTAFSLLDGSKVAPEPFALMD